jgi:hypothetical protein
MPPARKLHSSELVSTSSAATAHMQKLKKLLGSSKSSADESPLAVSTEFLVRFRRTIHFFLYLFTDSKKKTLFVG